MRIYSRKKKRQSGKTEDLINIVSIFARSNKRIVILAPTSNMLLHIKERIDIDNHKKYIFGTSNNIDSIFRGHWVDMIIVDDWHLFSPKAQESIHIYAHTSHASAIICTESK